MVGSLLRKFEGKLKRSYIEEIVNKFNKVRSILFYKGDIEQIVGSYLHYDKLIFEFTNNIQQLNRDIERCKQMKYEVLNKSVLQLRSENKLGNWLNELSDKELMELKNIVDIEKEYKVISDYRFNKSKEERGRVVIKY
jgi:hypothetical protein